MSIHKTKRAKSTNWGAKHAEYIQYWNDRHNHFVFGEAANGVVASIEYMNWYWDRTVIHVVHPNRSQGSGFNNISGRHEVLMEGVGIMHHEFANLPSENAVYQVPQRYMDFTGASHRLNIQSTLYNTHHDQFPGPPPHPVQRAPRQRPRRGPQMQDEGPSTVTAAGPSTYEATGPFAYEASAPSTFTAPGPSTFAAPGPSVRPFDLNVGLSPQDIYDMVAPPTQAQPMTPSYGSQSIIPTRFSSPLLPEQPLRDIFGIQSRDISSPVAWPNELMFMTPEQTLTQTADVDELIGVEQEELSWRLARDREPRERRPRGPCFTADRHSRHGEHGDGAN